MADELPKPTFAIPAISFHVGEKVILVDVFVFQCPLCHREFRWDDRYEPLCTGPWWTDDHPPEVMRFVRKDTRRVFV
jgi:hypothetical protein